MKSSTLFILIALFSVVACQSTQKSEEKTSTEKSTYETEVNKDKEQNDEVALDETEEPKQPKKRERRRQQRRRKSQKSEDSKKEEKSDPSPEKVELPPPPDNISEGNDESKSRESASNIIRSLLGSPPPLISETIGQYRESYQQAFYEKTEGEEEEEQNPENLPIEKSEDLPTVKEEELPVATEEQGEEASAPKKSLWDFTD